MRRQFAVTVAATSLQLLTDQEMRVAAGLASNDGSKDATLQALGLKVADRIARYCGVTADAMQTPTLLEETCVETLRDPPQDTEILLSRRFVTVTSIVQDGVTLDAADYVVNRSSGGIMRLVGDAPSLWSSNKIVVTYKAGFVTAPPALKGAADQLFRVSLSSDDRDPLLKSVEIPDVGRREFWVSGAESHDIPRNVQDMLGPFMNVVFA